MQNTTLPDRGPFITMSQNHQWELELVEHDGRTLIDGRWLLALYAHRRGEIEEEGQGSIANSSFWFELPRGEVALLSGIMSERGRIQRTFAREQGVATVLLIRTAPESANGAPAFHVPDQIKHINHAPEPFLSQKTFRTSVASNTKPAGNNTPARSSNAETRSNEPVETRVLTMKSPSAATVELLRKSLREDVVMAADENGKFLILKGPRNQLDEAQDIFVKIAPQDSEPINQSTGQLTDAVVDLKRRYDEKEKEAASFAREIRNSRPPSDRQRETLRRIVTEAFALRQQLHEAELTEFRERMDRVQRLIQSREQIKDQIINRRVDDLVDPKLKWDGESPVRVD